MFNCSLFQGYDMEDAMIINKSSFERGFAHGSILKSEFIDLKSVSSRDLYVLVLYVLLIDTCILSSDNADPTVSHTRMPGQSQVGGVSQNTEVNRCF